MAWNLKKWAQHKCLTFCIISKPVNCKNRLEIKILLWNIAEKISFCSNEILSLQIVDLKECESHFKNKKTFQQNVYCLLVLTIHTYIQGSHSHWKKWEGIFQSGKSQGILNRLEKSGKTHKYWKTEINWDKYYLIFLVIFKWNVHYLLKWIKFSVKKKQQNIKKILEKWQ